ncbi:MAG: di-trans,poly-cis-decaprenylcistransferase [Hymenobacter sp.]|nr:MAG: di-trans,poly-cis-decaprenylcistransferase [Hymenobacter sp.]
MAERSEIDLSNIPAHVAVIMDGNGRWAKQRGGLRVFGHQSAITSVRDTVEEAAELGVKYLTLYAFSTENWNRPATEVMALMQLLVHTIGKETKTLLKNSVRLQAIGDLATLPGSCQRELAEAMELTKGGTRMTLVLALSYSGRWDLTQATRRLAYTELYIMPVLWPDFRRSHFREALLAYQSRERRFGKTSEQLAVS